MPQTPSELRMGICFGQQRGFDPTSGLCITRQENRGGDMSTIYYVPGQTMSTTAPIAESDPNQFRYPGAAPPSPIPTGVYIAPPPAATGFDLGGIGTFFSSPSPLGVSWGVVGIGVVIAVVLFASSSGGSKSKGWL